MIEQWENKIIQGEALEVLKQMPDESVHCAITSPPYWGLRDYGIDPMVWGGKEDCEHVWGDNKIKKSTAQQDNGPGGGVWNARSRGRDLSARRTEFEASQGQFCQLCGAWLGSLGLEPTPELYVEHLVEICRELKRVLRKDGTFWLNMGDSYASEKGTCFNPGGGTQSLGQNKKEMGAHPLDRGNISTLRESGLKPKDLCGMPWRVALALQADGWWLRSDIIWSKPNPMPESVTDRPTRSHEYVFLLTKNKKYFYDADAIKEKTKESTIIRYQSPTYGGGQKLDYGDKKVSRINPIIGSKPGHKNALIARGANKRTVWTIATQPFPESHFAVFPNNLVRPMILAGTSEYGCCSKCGTPWERIVEKTGHINKREPAHVPFNAPTKTDSTGWKPTTIGTNKWRPTCKCITDYSPTKIKPCVVLDPCVGSGTVPLVAAKLGRNYIGIDLKQEYIDMAEKRLKPHREQLKMVFSD